MENTLAALAAAAVGLQDEKRRNLDRMLANFAKKAMAVVDDQVALILPRDQCRVTRRSHENGIFLLAYSSPLD